MKSWPLLRLTLVGSQVKLARARTLAVCGDRADSIFRGFALAGIVSRRSPSVEVPSCYNSEAPPNACPPSARLTADRARARSQATEILALLRDAGAVGRTNAELWTIAHAAHSRIAELRACGHVITCTREAPGLYRYRLIEGPQSAGEPSPEMWPTLPLFAGAGACE